MSIELLQAIKIICTENNYGARVNIINYLLPLTEDYDYLVNECDGNEDKADEQAFADFLVKLASVRKSIDEFLNANKYFE